MSDVPPPTGDEHDDDAAQRDRTADDRDTAATDRDTHADHRDHVADLRDAVAGRRDELADERDRLAERSDGSVGERLTVAHLQRAVAARGAAAADRELASRDRTAWAADRGRAEHDRTRAEHDRVGAEHDRAAAQDDRGSSARERRDSSLDALTGAHQRGPGQLALVREMARSTREQDDLVLAFVDVDQMKAVNDSGGHHVGDELLRGVVVALRGAFRPYDTIIRHGGDEFLCVLPGMRETEARTRITEVNRVLARADPPGSVTAGLAEMLPGDSREQLVARADEALYRDREARRSAT